MASQDDEIVKKIKDEVEKNALESLKRRKKVRESQQGSETEETLESTVKSQRNQEAPNQPTKEEKRKYILERLAQQERKPALEESSRKNGSENNTNTRRDRLKKQIGRSSNVEEQLARRTEEQEADEDEEDQRKQKLDEMNEMERGQREGQNSPEELDDWMDKNAKSLNAEERAAFQRSVGGKAAGRGAAAGAAEGGTAAAAGGTAVAAGGAAAGGAAAGGAAAGGAAVLGVGWPVILVVVLIIILILIAIFVPLALYAMCNSSVMDSGSISEGAAVLGIRSSGICQQLGFEEGDSLDPALRGEGVGVATGKLTDAEAREYLRLAYDGEGGATITVNRPQPGTSLQNINVATVLELIKFKRECDGWAAARGPCQVVVTGGTEPGHAAGACSHSAGYKADIRVNSLVDDFVKHDIVGMVIGNDFFTKMDTRGDGAAQYVANNRSIYARESNHWDILVGCGTIINDTSSE